MKKDYIILKCVYCNKEFKKPSNNLKKINNSKIEKVYVLIVYLKYPYLKNDFKKTNIRSKYYGSSQ